MIRSICGFILFFLLLESTISSQASKVDQEKLLSIYFATTREKVNSRMNTKEFGFGSAVSRQITYGVARVAIPTGGENRANKRSNYRIISLTKFENSAQFLRSMDAASARLKARSVRGLIFVHGFNESFSGSILRAAQVINTGKLNVLPIVFVWPSADNFLAYGKDVKTANASAASFAIVARLVNERNHFSSLFVFAHSMGSRVLLGAIKKKNWYSTRPISGIILASPDISLKELKSSLPKLLRAASRVLILASTKDDLLFLSSIASLTTVRVGNANEVQFRAAKIAESSRLRIVRMDTPLIRNCEGGTHRCAETHSVVLTKIRSFIRQNR